MNICICDDDCQTHACIQNLILENSVTKNDHRITSLFSGEELIQHYQNNQFFDLIFLDVEMEQANGIEAAKKIRQTDEQAIIIFVSSYRQYVFDVFPVGAFHYIIKPINPKEFAEVFRRSVQKYRDLHAEICLKWMYDRHNIPIHSIIYLEGIQRHVIFHTKVARYEGVGKVSDYVDELIPNGFVQVHHSYIVNISIKATTSK